VIHLKENGGRDMTATEKVNFDLMLLKSTPEFQRSLLKWLLVKTVAEQGPDPLELTGDDGVPMGVFLPNSKYRNKPPMSPERDAELLERVRNIREEDLLTLEEMMERLGLGESHQPKKQ
jgi:hypothetical protein